MSLKLKRYNSNSDCSTDEYESDTQSDNEKDVKVKSKLELNKTSQSLLSMLSEQETKSKSIKTTSQVNIQGQPEILQKKRITFKDANRIIYEAYDDIPFFSDMCNKHEIILSSSLDILAIYLKGQKILYTEAKVYCETQLNSLMLPAILISAFCTVLSIGLKDHTFGSIIISSLTAINSFILTLISYLKLDAKAEAHKTSAYQFDKLQESTEFMSGKVLFFNPETIRLKSKDEKMKHKTKTKTEEKEKEKTEDQTTITIVEEDKDEIDLISMKQEVINLVKNIETKVGEIKEMNKFILPESIRYKFHKLYSNNIFSLIKKIQTKETKIKIKLQRLLNLIRDTEIEFDIKINEFKTQKDNYQNLLIEIEKKTFLKPNIICKNKEGDVDCTCNPLCCTILTIPTNIPIINNTQDDYTIIEIKQKQKYYEREYNTLVTDKNKIMTDLRENRATLLLELIDLHDEYGVESKEILAEIENNVNYKLTRRCNCFRWLKT
jgi:hypothetical protein